jgi:hypothetical protein
MEVAPPLVSRRIFAAAHFERGHVRYVIAVVNVAGVGAKLVRAAAVGLAG